MLNRLILVIHWGVFLASVGCLVGGTVPIIGNITTPEPICKQVANPNYGDHSPYENTSPFTITADEVFRQPNKRTIRKCSGPYPPKADDGIALILSGLGMSVIFAILLFIIKGKWIWFPWQHDKN